MAIRRQVWVWLLFLILGVSTVIAQGNLVAVPDLTGLNAPRAAAALNSVGLRLGTEGVMDLAEGEGLPAGSIGAQSIEPGTQVDVGTAVDIFVLRSPNMQLIYDDNDFTLVNTTNNVADVTGLRFVSVEGLPASFAATRWSSSLRERRCLQLWSISRRDPKNLDECENIQNWLTTNNTGEHFWTQTNGVQRFSVIDNGVERTTCPAAPPNKPHLQIWYKTPVKSLL